MSDKDIEKEFNVYLHNAAYNINKFMSNHPGGTTLLHNMENKDVAKQMSKFEHSKYAYRLLEDYKDRNENTLKNGHHKPETLDTAAEEIVAEIRRLQRIEELVDWSQPMLSQLDKLGSDYSLWVRCPVDKKLRMFKSPVLESMTFTPWYAVLIFWIPIICFLLWHTYTAHVLCEEDCLRSQINTYNYVLHLIMGVALWSFIEYCLHRWVFHCDPGNSLRMKQFHFLIHGLHHKVPFDNLRQVFPPLPAMFLTLLIYQIVKLLLSRPDIATTGGLIGYLLYDITHFYLHYGSPGDETFMYNMKRYHANHHFVNPDQGFGISSKIWDDVFDTKIKLKKLGFSLSWK